MRRAYGLLVSILFACAHPTDAPTTPMTTPAPPPTTPAAMPTSESTAVGPVTPAQSTTPEVSGYDKPPQYVLDVLHAPAPARPMMAPTRD